MSLPFRKSALVLTGVFGVCPAQDGGERISPYPPRFLQYGRIDVRRTTSCA